MTGAQEKEAILAEARAFADAWNRGDAPGAASFFTEDGVRVGATGDVQRGRPAIEAAYRRLLNEVMPGARVIQEEGTVRLLTAELAVWQGGIEIQPAGGGASLKGHAVHIVRKVEDRWLILEGHPKLFPTLPG